MTTTIQVSDTTKQLLDQLKEQEDARSFDEVIRELAQARTKTPTSMFGSAKKLTSWKKEDRDDRNL